jgi:hypothetical protein
MKLIKRAFWSIAAITLLAAAPPAISQDDSTVEKPQVYQVEILIFRHTDQSRTTSEIPRMPEQEIVDILEQDLPKLELDDSSLLADEALGDTNPAGWQLVEGESLLLNRISRRLNDLAAYDLLDHRGWIQLAPDVAESAEISLADLGLAEDIATGQINLFQRRYLHLAVDVALSDANSNADNSNSNLFADTFQVFAAPKAVPAITDSRRIRLEELVYFDQPKFGVLAMVARSDKELPQAIAPDM